MSSALHWIGLFAAGGCGVCLRYLLALKMDAALAVRFGARALPFAGTLVVNLLGCLAIGGLARLLPEGPVKIAVLVGLLGGFTTYSTFALMSVELAKPGRWEPFGWQLGLHLVGGMLMVILGAWLADLSRPTP